jgi:hypothetical protein
MLCGTQYTGTEAEPVRYSASLASCNQKMAKLEYASVAWNSLTLTDSNRLESIQKKFAHLCY